MLDNIKRYVNINQPKNSLFIVGAAHINSIVELINENKNNTKNNYKWIYKDQLLLKYNLS